MTAFVAFAVLFVLAALVLVLPPLLKSRRDTDGVSREAANVTVYRDQLRELEDDLAAGLLTPERYEEARREVERRVLEDAASDGESPGRRQGAGYAAVIVGVSVPVLAGMLYLATGTPAALDPERIAAGEAHAIDRQEMEALVERLAQKLRESPEGNAEGWAMLARSYNSMGRYAEAVEAYRIAVNAGTPDARLLADYADALAMTQGRNLLGEPEKLIARALELDPQNVKALALAGTVEFDKQNYRAAAEHWEKILPLVPPGSEIARSLESSIAEARTLAGVAAPSRAGGQAAVAADAAAAGGAIAGEVRIDPALAARVSPGDTVFIFARPAEGSRMPVAILRKNVADLPAKFVLDDAAAMTPQGKLSAYPQLVVGARVSKSGSAVPQAGDLEGLSAPVRMGAAGTVVVIDRVIP
jgi:cytochrome c-type biogenesis protein CcmH